jgi:hypothetical protein
MKAFSAIAGLLLTAMGSLRALQGAENLDFAVVRDLRSAGHDVRALAEETTRTVDAEVIALAARES